MSNLDKNYFRSFRKSFKVLFLKNIRFVIDPLFPAKRMNNEDFINKNDFELLL